MKPPPVARLGACLDLIVAAGAALFLIALTLAVHVRLRPLVSFDAAVSEAALHTALAHPVWRSTMSVVTWTGSTAVIGPMAGAGCLLLLWRRRASAAAFIAITLPAVLITRLLVVNAVHRPRPVNRLAPAAGWSFPSGHTTAAATAALIAAMLCWSLVRRRTVRLTIGCLLTGWAVAVGVSRVALVVHWPSDVVGGWLLTLAVALPAARLLRRRLRPPTDGAATSRPHGDDQPM